MGGVAEQPGQARVDAPVVDGVAELVEHGVHPPLARLDVAEDAHVAFTIDVDAEGVLVLAVAAVEIAGAEDRPDVEPETVVGPHGQGLEVGGGEQRVELDRAPRRWILEEGIVEVPRRQLLAADAEASRERVVELRLPGSERRLGVLVHLVEGGEEPGLVHLADAERQREVVPLADRPGRLVPEPSQRSDAIGHRRADLLRRLPRPPAEAHVVARAQDVQDRVVGDALAVELASKRREGGLHVGLELHDLALEVPRHLVREHGVVEQVELASHVPAVVGVGAGRAHGGEGVGIGEELPPGQLELGLPAVGLVRGAGAGVPPRPGQLDLDRAEAPDEVVDQPPGVVHGGGVYG